MQIYNSILLRNIECEKTGLDYCYTSEDKAILQELFNEINTCTGTNIQYLAEMDAFQIKGSGEIIARYIPKFASESVKAYLIPQLVADKIVDCDKILLQLYLRFKESDAYISKPGQPSPAHISVRYDNGFRILKSKRLAADLVKLAYNPRDAFYLPFTMRMLASWRIPELKDLFIAYLSDSGVAAQDVGINEIDDFKPPLSFIKRELKFTAIAALKYYPSDSTTAIVGRYATDPDPDISTAAKRTLKRLSGENK